VITSYVDQALRRAHYSSLEDGTFCATVPALPGIIATGATVEECRDQLAEVVEEWVLVRVARGLRVPPLGRVKVVVKKAS
jgi:predicted RNase H-like HicB family nuclease